VSSLADLAKPGVTIAMGSASVPVGSYTRKVLGGLPAGQRAKILGNVRSNEPDVGGVIGKVTQGAVDAGFVYITDVKAAGGKVKAIELPASLQPRVAYAVAVVKGAKHPQQAKAFIAGLLNGAGATDLQKAGFEPPPS
jgi:molybdate transport system substrate-binding protein